MALYDLVFEGGGAKGAAFSGAMDAFAQAGHGHRRILGTSAGAITAALIGAGYTADELLQACTETLPETHTPVFTTFMDTPAASDFSPEMRQNSQTMALLKQVRIPVIGPALDTMTLDALLDVELYREVFSFNECGGFYAGNAFLNWLRAKLQAKGINPDITWKDFALRTGSDVSVVTSDVTEHEMVVLNSRTAPDCPVALSVRMSMSIPFVWREMIWEESWGLYRGRSKTGHVFVDGGVLSNFPVALMVETGPEISAIMGDTDPHAAGTIGLMLDKDLAVPGATNSDTRRPRLRSADRVTRLIDTMTDTSDDAVMRLYPQLICHLPVHGYGTTEFRMSQERMTLLVNAGRGAMNAYLNRLAATATKSA